MDMNKKSMRGIGYLGIGKYKAYINGKQTESYSIWSGMFIRCYDPKYHIKRPTYIGCQVHPEWHDYQAFAKWFENNYKQGYVLDKDILFKDNKIYSSQTCEFIPHEINSLFIKSNSIRGLYPIGVSLDKKSGKFKAYIKKYGKLIHLGFFDNPEDAFNKYKIEKELHAKEIANKFKNNISNELYNAICNYKVNSND